MAVDTALKRSSAIYVMMPWRSSLPIPDSAISQADRQVVVVLYSGILATTATTITLVNDGNLYITRVAAGSLTVCRIQNGEATIMRINDGVLRF